MVDQNRPSTGSRYSSLPQSSCLSGRNTFAFQLEFNYKIINSAKIQESFGTCACLILSRKSFLSSLHWLLLTVLRSHEAPRHPFPFSLQLHYVSQVAGQSASSLISGSASATIYPMPLVAGFNGGRWQKGQIQRPRLPLPCPPGAARRCRWVLLRTSGRKVAMPSPALAPRTSPPQLVQQGKVRQRARHRSAALFQLRLHCC